MAGTLYDRANAARLSGEKIADPVPSKPIAQIPMMSDIVRDLSAAAEKLGTYKSMYEGSPYNIHISASIDHITDAILRIREVIRVYGDR